MKLKQILVACLLLASSLAMAKPKNIVGFSEDELARESVLPKFDNPVSVLHRNVKTIHKVSLGAFLGMNLAEPFFSQSSFGLTATYHMNEIHGVNFLFNTWFEQLSSYAEQLQEQPDTALNLHLAPAPKTLLLASYQYAAYYGKMSLSKDIVSNLSLFGTAGVGGMTIGETMFPVLSVGMGQKFYLSNSFAFRFDLRLLTYQGPDYAGKSLRSETSPVPASEFGTKIRYSTVLSAGVTYLFPQLF